MASVKGPGVLRSVRGGQTGKPEGFELVYVDAAGEETRRSLAEAVTVQLENARPVRRFPSYRGQRNYPGLYYSATLGAHVEYESWLERDEAMVLDYAPEVVSFAAQPFWLFWLDTDRVKSYAPGFFARTADGGGVVIDCRPEHRVKPQDAVAFAATEQACAEVAWRFRLVTGHDPAWLANVRWLATATRVTPSSRSFPGCWRSSPNHGPWSRERRWQVIWSRCCRWSTTCCGRTGCTLTYPSGWKPPPW